MTGSPGLFSDKGLSDHTPDLFRNIRGVIFDFDGTLYDNILFPFYLIASFPPDIFRIRNERLVRKQHSGCDYSTPEAYHRSFFSALGKLCHCPPHKIQSWYFNRYMPRMIRVLRAHYKPRPGLNAFFDRVNALEGNPHYPRIAVYSDYPCVRERMEALGIMPGNGIPLYGPESFGAQKPAVRPFLSIAHDLSVSPHEVLVIGDREDTDGIGAFNAGMRFFCLETGHKRHYRLDPDRCFTTEQPSGPSLLMYAGAWDRLLNLLVEQYPSL